MPPAIIAGAIAAAGTIGGALLSSGAQHDAANQASAAQQDSTAAQLQLGHESLALQNQLAQQSLGLNQSIYNSNYDLLSPWVARGNVAGDTYSALLGLPSAPAMHSPLETASGGLAPIPTASGSTPSPTAGGAPATGYSGPSLEQINAMWHDGIPGNAASAQSAYDAAHQSSYAAPTNSLAPQTPAQQAQQAISMGADPAAVNARLASIGG